MRRFLAVLLLLLIAMTLFATQTYVIGEMYTSTTCGYCLPARSALAEMYDEIEDYPYFIPLIWQGNGNYASPAYQTRKNLYEFTGIPSSRWGGNILVHGYAAGQQYQRYVNAYNQVVVRNAPMELSVRMEINDDDELVVAADVEMLDNITTPSNAIVFILTYDLRGIMDPDYFASVVSYHEEAFSLTTAGEEDTFVKAFPFNQDWEMDRLTAVVFVQSFNAANPVIHQAGYRPGKKITAMFETNVQQGPPSLHVKFTSLSEPAYRIKSYEWDFDGDGEVDSYEENPTFEFTEPGTYTVSLTISDGVENSVMQLENYITVIDPMDVSGSISGEFKEEYAPYRITGDVFVPEDGFLKIEPGLQIDVDSYAITIEGLLEIDAEYDYPVTFYSDNTWQGLRLKNSHNENIIKNVRFLNAGATALQINDSEVSLFSNNTFTNNHNATGTAALEVEDSDFVIRNSLFVNNSGYSASAISVSGSEIELVNNTIANNDYTDVEGAHLSFGNSFIQVKNCIVRGDGNALKTDGDTMLLAEYSNISGGYDGLWIVDEDPLFEKPSDGAGYEFDGLAACWYLSDDSPSIDMGNPAAAFNDPEDPDNPGFALFPAKGRLRNDLGAYGGEGTVDWVYIEDDFVKNRPELLDKITAYPNPFNPNITISLDNIAFDENKPVALKIFNTKGQLVKTILNNEPIDKRNFSWNGLDSRQRPLPSGVYLINFECDKINMSKRVILLK